MFFCRLVNIGVGRLAKSIGVETAVVRCEGWLLVILLRLLKDVRV